MRTVMVVDDEKCICDLVRTVLENDDCRVLSAADGLTALQVAARERPDVIVLDCRLRGLSGLEVLRLLRADARTVRIPVILMSGFSNAELPFGRLGARADGFLLKPFRTVDLLLEIQHALRVEPAAAAA